MKSTYLYRPPTESIHCGQEKKRAFTELHLNSNPTAILLYGRAQCLWHSTDYNSGERSVNKHLYNKACTTRILLAVCILVSEILAPKLALPSKDNLSPHQTPITPILSRWYSSILPTFTSSLKVMLPWTKVRQLIYLVKSLQSVVQALDIKLLVCERDLQTCLTAGGIPVPWSAKLAIVGCNKHVIQHCQLYPSSSMMSDSINSNVHYFYSFNLPCFHKILPCKWDTAQLYSWI